MFEKIQTQPHRFSIALFCISVNPFAERAIQPLLVPMINESVLHVYRKNTVFGFVLTKREQKVAFVTSCTVNCKDRTLWLKNTLHWNVESYLFFG